MKTLAQIIKMPEGQQEQALEQFLDSIGQVDTQTEEATPAIAQIIEAHRWTFETFHPALKPMLPEAKRFVQDVLEKHQPRWLSFLGPSGIGKTLLMRQIIRLLRKHWERVKIGKDAYRSPMIAWLIPARDLQDWRSPRDYSQYDLIYIEDIGSGAGLDDGPGKVLRGRIAELLQLRTGKWTLLDANLSRGQIAEKIDARIASRLRRDGSVCISITEDVPDYNG